MTDLNRRDEDAGTENLDCFGETFEIEAGQSAKVGIGRLLGAYGGIGRHATLRW